MVLFLVYFLSHTFHTLEGRPCVNQQRGKNSFPSVFLYGCLTCIRFSTPSHFWASEQYDCLPRSVFLSNRRSGAIGIQRTHEYLTDYKVGSNKSTVSSSHRSKGQIRMQIKTKLDKDDSLTAVHQARFEWYMLSNFVCVCVSLGDLIKLPVYSFDIL